MQPDPAAAPLGVVGWAGRTWPAGPPGSGSSGNSSSWATWSIVVSTGCGERLDRVGLEAPGQELRHDASVQREPRAPRACSEGSGATASLRPANSRPTPGARSRRARSSHGDPGRAGTLQAISPTTSVAATRPSSRERFDEAEQHYRRAARARAPTSPDWPSGSSARALNATTDVGPVSTSRGVFAHHYDAPKRMAPGRTRPTSAPRRPVRSQRRPRCVR